VNFAFGEFRFWHFEISKIAKLDDATGESPFDQKSFECSESYTHDFAAFEFHILKTTTIDFDIREIGIEESTIDESAARKFTLTKITLLESAASEFAIA